MCGHRYTLFTDRKQYTSTNDERVRELQFILKLLRCWHQYNSLVDADARDLTASDRSKWGLSHQLFFDFECMVEVRTSAD